MFCGGSERAHPKYTPYHIIWALAESNSVLWRGAATLRCNHPGWCAELAGWVVTASVSLFKLLHATVEYSWCGKTYRDLCDNPIVSGTTATIYMYSNYGIQSLLHMDIYGKTPSKCPSCVGWVIGGLPCNRNCQCAFMGAVTKAWLMSSDVGTQ